MAFSDGTQPVPSGYVEFARRYELPGRGLFTGGRRTYPRDSSKDHPMKPFLLLALSAAALAAGVPAQGAVAVIGDSVGRDCFLHARDEATADEAIDACDTALYSDTLNNRDRAATLVNRGVIRLRRQEHDLALADFDAAIGRMPKLAEAHVDRGAALVMLGRHAEAIGALDHALTLGPESPQNGIFIRAIARERSGDIRGAYEDFRRAAEIAPKWDRPRRELQRFAVRPARQP